MKKIFLIIITFQFTTEIFSQYDPYIDNKDKKVAPEKKAPNADTTGRGKSSYNTTTRNVSSSPNTDIGAVLQIADMLSDKWTSRAVQLKFRLGAGYASTPVNANFSNTTYSTPINLRSLQFSGGFKLVLLNNKAITLEIQPDYYYNEMTQINKKQIGGGSVTGYHVLANLLFGTKSFAKVRPFVSAGYSKYSGITSLENADYNETNTLIAAPNTHEIDYTSIKAGAGIKFHFIFDEVRRKGSNGKNYKEGKEVFLMPAVYLEQPSFFTDKSKYVMSGSLVLNIANEIQIETVYSKNYYVPGVIDYKYDYTKANKDLFTIKLVRNGKLF